MRMLKSKKNENTYYVTKYKIIVMNNSELVTIIRLPKSKSMNTCDIVLEFERLDYEGDNLMVFIHYRNYVTYRSVLNEDTFEIGDERIESR